MFGFLAPLVCTLRESGVESISTKEGEEMNRKQQAPWSLGVMLGSVWALGRFFCGCPRSGQTHR